jgi:cation diffusion facilitator CzcD-associated flavoprotein CzcO
MREHHDTIVIGGGQAGLAMSAVLQKRGREHIVPERRQIGEHWRTERWESLRFQFPNWSLELPGAHVIPIRLQAPARSAAVPRQGRLLVAGQDGPLCPEN